MTYSEIMAALLQAYEAHPEMEVQQIIAQVAHEMGASEKCMEDINSSLLLLDKMQEKKSSLEAAHENGDTTKRWILAETDKLTAGGNDEDKAAIAEGIAKAVDRGVQHDRHHCLNLYPSAPRTRQIRFLS
jgi:predicted chitinase